jgi:hypothetical protein
MINVVLAVLMYECLLALAYIWCWRLVRVVDTRLPILSSGPTEAGPGALTIGRGGPRRTPALQWQVFAFLLGSTVLVLIALGAAGALGDLRTALIASSAPVEIHPALVRLALPIGQLVVLLVLYLTLRQSVLFPTVAVHLFLALFCLLVSMLDPSRMEIGRLTLVPIFATNLVLLVVTHGLLTLLFCQSRRELVVSVVLAAIAGGLLALGTMMISLVSTLLAGPLFFFQLYLISAFGIFGLYFCASSIFLSLWARD